MTLSIVGSCTQYVYLSVASRRDVRVVHEVMVRKDGAAFCSCGDAVFHKKVPFYHCVDSPRCYHAVVAFKFLELLGRQVAGMDCEPMQALQSALKTIEEYAASCR